MEEKFISLAILKAKEGKTDELKAALLKLTVPTRQEIGCLEYVLFEGKNQPGTLYMREAFKSKEAFDAHIASPHFTEFIAQKDEILAGDVTVIELVPV